jgi:hypothetical protein
MITGILIFTIFALALFTMGAYLIVAPWWKHRAGRAYMTLFASLTLLTGFFLVEQLAGQQPEWIQSIFIGLVAFAIGFNCYTIVSKQVRAWRIEHPENHHPEGL